MDDGEAELTLVKKLREVVKLFHSVVEDCTGATTLMILTTRLPYKIHLHFPQVIVDATNAKIIVKAFVTRFEQEHQDLFSPSVADTSIYNTGLRLLYCHKGSMTNAAKLNKEKTIHAQLFPSIPYCDVYYITDEETWVQNKIPCIEGLESTSLPVSSDIPLTKLACVDEPTPVKHRVGTRNKSKNTSDTREVKGMEDLTTFLSVNFSVCEQDIRINDKFVKDSVTVIPTISKTCPFVARNHTSNHVYFVLKSDSVELRCHSMACKGKASISPISQGSISTLATTNDKTPLSVLSDTLNETFNLPDNEWIDRGLVGRKGSRFYEMAPTSTRCLHHHDFEHPVPSLCKLCFREGDVDRILKVVCPKYGIMDVTGELV